MIPLTIPALGAEELAACERVLKSGMLVQGQGGPGLRGAVGPGQPSCTRCGSQQWHRGPRTRAARPGTRPGRRGLVSSAHLAESRPCHPQRGRQGRAGRCGPTRVERHRAAVRRSAHVPHTSGHRDRAVRKPGAPRRDSAGLARLAAGRRRCLFARVHLSGTRPVAVTA